MAHYILRRLGVALLLLWVVLTTTFFLLHIAPGEPTLLFEDPRIGAEQRQRLRDFYGLDEPIGTQYAIWLGKVVRGDWGTSITQQRSAARVLADRFPATVLLAAAVLLLEYGLGIALGVWAAGRAGSWWDHQIRIFSMFVFTVPVFWLALLAIEVLGVRWQLFPVQQMSSDAAADLSLAGRLLDVAHHLILPAAVLGLGRCGAVMRFVRNGLLEVLQQDYIRTATAIGLGRRRILWVHALKNAVGPLVQRFGLTLPGLLSGTVVIEVIFSWPGVGSATFNALSERDYPVVLAATGFSGALVVLSTLATDLIHAVIDPRVRHRVQ